MPVLEAGEPLAKARAAMILVHGRGATAQDIMTLAEDLMHPGFAYLAPQAAGNAWYPNPFTAPLEANEPYLTSALGVELSGRVLSYFEGNEVARTALFAHGTMLSNILAGLYYEWSAGTRSPTPILYDPMTLASLLEPSLCPLTPMHIRVDDAGNTLVEQGPPNAQVCLHSDADAFLRFTVKKIAGR